MRFSAPRLLAAIAALAATAAAPALRLTAPHNGELPRIASPAMPAAAKINAALAVLDRRWAGYVRQCRASARDNEASRTVAVTMMGPRFLSIVASDEESCGGAHPDTSTLALVYDLTTGRPVDWRQLLGSRLVTATRTDTVIDGTRAGFARSRELSRLYLRGLKKSPDYDPAWWNECQETLTDEHLEFIVWPDARKHGLVAEPQVVHALAPCAEDVAIPAADLRQAGASAELIRALGG